MYGGTSSKSYCWYETEGGVRKEEVGWNDAVEDRCDAHAEAHVEVHVEAHVKAHDRALDDGTAARGVTNAADCHGAVEARCMAHLLDHLVQKKTHLVDE